MDGLDAGMASEWMDAGELPNFVRLRDGGTFCPLVPGNPAQSPVSWATLNTGRNPGKHGIFDFVSNTRHPQAGPMPGVGFQKETWIPASRTGALDLVALGFRSGGAVLAGILIFIFLRRRLLPALVLSLLLVGWGGWSVLSALSSMPKKGFKDYETLVKAESFWMDLDRAGVPFRGHGTVVSYPVEPMEHGKVVAGLGAPDAKGGLQGFSMYTTSPVRVRGRKTYKAEPARAEADAESPDARSGRRYGAGVLYLLEEGGPGKWVSKVFGPQNQVRKEKLEAELGSLKGSGSDPERAAEVEALLRGGAPLLQTWVPLEVSWRPGQGEARISLDGSTQRVGLGSWTDFFRVSFRWNAHLATEALVRIWIEADGEEGLELYASPPQVSPWKPGPGVRNSWPPGFSASLADEVGGYETLGWACQTHAVKDLALSDDAFLADLEFTIGWRRRMLESAMRDGDWRVLFHFFGSPDRVCHMLMRHIDPLHPQHDPVEAERTVPFLGADVPLKGTALAVYREMDEVVGWLLDEGLAEGDVLLIVSDHGFDSFRRQVNLNNWLAREGFLKVRTTDRYGIPLPVRRLNRRPLDYVDWEETRAYSMAIGKIYLALSGREAKGTVREADASSVVDELSERLMELVDPETGQKVVRRVYRREEIYSGPWVDEAPEITIDFAPGYRVSWNCTTGKINLKEGQAPDGGPVARADDGKVLYDNLMLWSGDHCGVDVEAVLGVFFSNRSFVPGAGGRVDATQLAPTVLSLAGVSVPTDYDGAPLVQN